MIPDVSLDRLTNSRAKTARACLREHFFAYELGMRPAVEAEALRWGTLIHKGLEAWWKCSPEVRLEAALLAVQGEADDFTRIRAEVTLQAYDLRWGAEAYETLAVEAYFDAPLRNPETGRASRTWLLAGKLDVVVRDPRDGRTLLVEHKTSSEDISPGSDYWRRLRLDSQVSTYYDGGAALGLPIDGCLYDVLGKPQIKPLKATPEEARKYTRDGKLYASQRAEDETPEEFRLRLIEAYAADPNRYFQRGEVARLEEELEEARFDLWQQGEIIREARRLNRWPRNPDACDRFHRLCAYFDVCTGVASIHDPTRFKHTGPHPELDSSSKEEPLP